MSSPYTTLGLPPDGVAWAALGVACALLPALFGPPRRALGSALRSVYLLPALALSAALLSAGYVAFYLRGGPRIIDSTSYYLQARAMAHGYFAFPVPAPLGSFEGRFLLANESHSLSVIFPPGYASLLALGFLAHAPMLVGPVVGALIVLATYALASTVTGRSAVGYVAAALSVVCAALRYHTADTMSHGLCALLLCAGALYALRARRFDALQSGLAFGWLFATRPVSGAVGVLIALCLLERSARRWAWFALGLVPGVLLLLLYQRAATGSFWASTQLAYYARADGPPGCFRYGFGRGIGCLFEHGEYVRTRLQNGYGLREAASNTLRRLAVHSIDIANAAPLALLCPVGAWLGRAQRGVRPLFFGCLGLMLAYAPFYFDGSYPGGGTRLFAELLPLEHVLLAVALVQLEWTAFALPLSLAGFALHASFAHRALAEREGGRPMFEASALAHAGIDHGLVFVDTDHGFNLGHDPGQLDAQHHLVVARYESDAHDWLLWDRLQRPPSYRYRYITSTSTALGRPELTPYTPSPTPLRFESEAEWPPLAVEHGWVQPDFVPCASHGRGLRLHPTDPSAGMAIEFELPATGRSLRLGWVRTPGPPTRLTLFQGAPKVRPNLFQGGDHVPAERFQGANKARAELFQGGDDGLGDLFQGEGGRRVGVIQGGGDEACVEIDVEGFPGTGGRVRLEASRPGLLDFVEVRP